MDPKLPYRVYRVVAKVKSVHRLRGEDTCGKGPCEIYKPGDKMVFEKCEIRGKICSGVLASMMYKVWAMRLGLDPPYAKPGVSDHICPDTNRPVIFELRRVEDE